MNFENLTEPRAIEIAAWLWNALCIVWLVLWFGSKRAKKLETRWQRLQHLVPVVASFALLFGKGWKIQGPRVIPSNSVILWAGVLVTALGMGISVWARLSLGANWSGMVTLKQDHELVRKGLYRWIRHPIYTGILLGFIGTAIIRGNYGAGVGFVILLLSFYFKARREENFLRQEFGEGFEEHLRRTGMFLPRLT